MEKERKYKGYPDFLAPDEVKNTEDYGLQMGLAISDEWFNRDGGNCLFETTQDKFHKLRLYARGEQPTEDYKKLLGIDDESYSNYDLRPIQVVPKFVKLRANQVTSRLFDIKAEAIDKFSTDLKGEYRKDLEDKMNSQPAVEEAKEQLGIDLTPKEGFMGSQDEIDVHMKIKYKTELEIATEDAIKYTLDLNNYDEIQSKVVEDKVVLGIGAIKHETDPNKGIVVRYVKPENLVHSYTENRNFDDVHYFGEYRRVTIDELKRLSNNKFTIDELEEISQINNKWSASPLVTNSQNLAQNTNDISGMVDILDFTFKTTNTITYKKRYNENGGYKMVKKSSDFDKKDKNYKGFDVVKKTIEVWYKGTLIIGTEKIFGYGLCENMIRPHGFLNKTLPSYIVYASEIYQNKPKGEVEKIIGYVDQMNQIQIKIQQVVAKARPNGVFFDLAGLEAVTMDGKTLDLKDLIKIHADTGHVVGSSLDDEGQRVAGGGQSIRDIQNSIGDKLNSLTGAYLFYMNLLRDAFGVAQGADASMPHPDTLVGVQEIAEASSNSAGRHLLDGMLSISERLGKGLGLRLKDIFQFSDLKDVYTSAIGKYSVKALKALEKYHLHDLGINITLKPDAQEKQALQRRIDIALTRELITLSDSIDIEEVANIKYANQLLKIKEENRAKQKQANQLEIVQANTQAQEKSAQIASQTKMASIQAESQGKIGLIQAQSQAKAAEIEMEKKAKLELMEREFQYNMQIQGIQVKAQNDKIDKDNKEKSNRQREMKTMESELKDQVHRKSPPKKFESSEDNISGGIELDEFV